MSTKELDEILSATNVNVMRAFIRGLIYSDKANIGRDLELEPKPTSVAIQDLAPCFPEYIRNDKAVKEVFKFLPSCFNVKIEGNHVHLKLNAEYEGKSLRYRKVKDILPSIKELAQSHDIELNEVEQYSIAHMQLQYSKDLIVKAFDHIKAHILRQRDKENALPSNQKPVKAFGKHSFFNFAGYFRATLKDILFTENKNSKKALQA